MLKLEKNIREILKDDYERYMSTSVSIAKLIAEVAHKRQTRLDGTSYINHPSHMVKLYEDLVQIYRNDFDSDEIYGLDLPYDGVIEVCWLHDVIEDTEYTLEEIEDIYIKQDLGRYFDIYIKNPLILITHIKSEPYPIYTEKVCQNNISALVKFLDLYDNSNPFTLDKFEESELKRMSDYLSYMKIINDKYDYIQKFNLYMKICYLYDAIKNQ